MPVKGFRLSPPGSEDLFDRTGTTIFPHTAGDSLDLLTGNLTTTGSIYADGIYFGTGHIGMYGVSDTDLYLWNGVGDTYIIMGGGLGAEKIYWQDYFTSTNQIIMDWNANSIDFTDNNLTTTGTGTFGSIQNNGTLFFQDLLNNIAGPPFGNMKFNSPASFEFEPGKGSWVFTLGLAGVMTSSTGTFDFDDDNLITTGKLGIGAAVDANFKVNIVNTGVQIRFATTSDAGEFSGGNFIAKSDAYGFVVQSASGIQTAQFYNDGTNSWILKTGGVAHNFKIDGFAQIHLLDPVYISGVAGSEAWIGDTDLGARFLAGNYDVYLADNDAGMAGSFTDGTRTIQFADGTYALNVVAGNSYFGGLLGIGTAPVANQGITALLGTAGSVLWQSADYDGAATGGLLIYGYDDRNTKYLGFGINSAGEGIFKTSGNMTFYSGTSTSNYVYFQSYGDLYFKVGDAAGARKWYFRDSNNVAILTLDSDGNATFLGNVTIDSDTAGLYLGADQDVLLYANEANVLRATGSFYPGTDNTYYLGKNDDDTPAAWKGVILKDTTNGKYYRVEIINGVVTATDLTD